MDLRSAIKAVDRAGALLVFPIKNDPKIPSLWSHFFPRSKMKWEWDDNGDHRVAELWHLRAQLATSQKVVYAKWFRGRATVFSRELLPALLRVLNRDFEDGLSRGGEKVLAALRENSPLSTKQIKSQADLRGRFYEAEYNRYMKELWQRLLILGVGEVDDGAFPSLAVAATQSFFEEEYLAAKTLDTHPCFAQLQKTLGPNSVFYKYIVKLSSDMAAQKISA